MGIARSIFQLLLRQGHQSFTIAPKPYPTRMEQHSAVRFSFLSAPDGECGPAPGALRNIFHQVRVGADFSDI